VTLTRLVLAWLPVTAGFVMLEGWGIRPRKLTRQDVLWRSLEAAAVTLFASLWFDSLGHGGWWLLFLLAGVMVSLARFPDAPGLERGTAVRHALRAVVRYLVAGAILAWRLNS